MANSTFATARNLGFLERGGVNPIQVQDSLKASNRVDIFKFSIQPGPGFRVKSSFQSKGGSMRFSFFIQDPISGQFTQLVSPKKVAGKGSTEIAVQDIPVGAPALDCYIKFDRPTENVKYKFTLVSI